MKDYLKQKLSAKTRGRLVFVFLKIKLLFTHKEIGRGTFIARGVQVLGWVHVQIGKNCVIGEGALLSVNVRIKNFKHILIGNSVYIGRRNLISPGLQTTFGDFSITGNDCRFHASDHVFSDPFIPYVASGVTDGNVQKIGINAWLGSNVIVMGNVSIGHGCVIGALSMVTKNIPPFSIAVGNPCRVIKRYDMKQKTWISVEDFSETLEQLLPSEAEYVKELENNCPEFVMPRIAASQSYGDLP